jgi:predicted RNase H-related nuclease YkuK (DUF458 family)
MLEAAIKAIKESSKESSVYIGCDSRVTKRKDPKTRRTIATAKYTTVIVIHKDSCKGGQIFYVSESHPDYGDCYTRMMKEVEVCLQVFEPISKVIDGRHLEIHLDINSDKAHKSNVAMQAAMGYVRGVTGLDPKIKPHGWAATHAADHMVRR